MKAGTCRRMTIAEMTERDVPGDVQAFLVTLPFVDGPDIIILRVYDPITAAWLPRAFSPAQWEEMREAIPAWAKAKEGQ